FGAVVRRERAGSLGFPTSEDHPPPPDQVGAIQKRERGTAMISSQPRYNLLDRHVEDGHAGFCRKHGIGMIVYSPLAQGVLTNKYAGGARPPRRRAAGAVRHLLESPKGLAAGEGAAAARRPDGGAARDPQRGPGPPG